MDGKEKILVLFLSILLSFLLFFNLGVNYLTNWDEAWYADITRTMVETGGLLTPIWNFEPFFEKPPLYFWLSAISAKMLGLSEITMRLPSALFGLSTGLIIYLFGRSFFNKETAVISFLILSSSPLFLYRSRTGNIDTLLTFFILVSFYAFYLGYFKNRKWFIVMGIFAGLAFLAKGIVGLYPLGLALFVIALKKRRNFLRSREIILSIVFAFVIGGGWFLLYYIANGENFIKQFLHSNTEKFTIGTGSLMSFSLDYIWHLKSGLKIWFLLLPGAILYALLKKKDEKIFFLFLIVFVFIAIMSFANNKSNWFILPVYPFIAILIGNFLSQFMRKLLSKRLVVAIICIFIAAMLVNLKYKNEYIVADIAAGEAEIAIEASRFLGKNETLYITNYYFPTIVYYSRRKTYAIYSDNEQSASWWIRPKNEWIKILGKPDVKIITTKVELTILKETFPNYLFEVLFEKGDKLLVNKI